MKSSMSASDEKASTTGGAGNLTNWSAREERNLSKSHRFGRGRRLELFLVLCSLSITKDIYG